MIKKYVVKLTATHLPSNQESFGYVKSIDGSILVNGQENGHSFYAKQRAVQVGDLAKHQLIRSNRGYDNIKIDIEPIIVRFKYDKEYLKIGD